MKTGFAPISVEDFIELHLEANPDESRKGLTHALKEALASYKRGELCRCGNPIWVIGSAIVGHACFTCITLEAVPDSDYEIDEACE